MLGIILIPVLNKSAKPRQLKFLILYQASTICQGTQFGLMKSPQVWWTFPQQELRSALWTSFWREAGDTEGPWGRSQKRLQLWSMPLEGEGPGHQKMKTNLPHQSPPRPPQDQGPGGGMSSHQRRGQKQRWKSDNFCTTSMLQPPMPGEAEEQTSLAIGPRSTLVSIVTMI